MLFRSLKVMGDHREAHGRGKLADLPLHVSGIEGLNTSADRAHEMVMMARLADDVSVTAIPGVAFAGSNDGHMRAYAAADGRVLWDFDTMREFTTVNGVKARGGSIDGPGAVVVGGMVFVNSGYSRNGAVPGNVLLAFAP